MAATRIKLNQRAIDALTADPGARALLLETARPFVTKAQGKAPKATGEGAASIAAEAVLDSGEWTARISWDQTHFYMYYHETGTRIMPARPFLVPSFE